MLSSGLYRVMYNSNQLSEIIDFDSFLWASHPCMVGKMLYNSRQYVYCQIWGTRLMKKDSEFDSPLQTANLCILKGAWCEKDHA